MRKRVNTLFFRLESLICVDKNEGWEGLFQPGVRLIEENSNFSALLVRQSPFRGGDVCCSCCECCKILGPSGSTLVGRGRGEGLRRILVSAWDRSACSADQQSAVPPIGNRRPRFSRSVPPFPKKSQPLCSRNQPQGRVPSSSSSSSGGVQASGASRFGRVSPCHRARFLAYETTLPVKPRVGSSQARSR